MQAETSYPAILGRVLEHKRKGKNLDQKDVADHLGLTQSAWSKIERGQSGISMEQLLRVSQLLKTQPHSILEDVDLAKHGLEKQGVIVHASVASKPSDTVALIALAVLGVMVVAILSKK